MDDNKKYYRHSSKYIYNNKYYKELEKDYRKELEYLEKDSFNNQLLDSSLITHSKQKRYDIKLVNCGEYIQVYQYLSKKNISDKNLEKAKDIPNMGFKVSENQKESELKKIEQKNINRSKMSLQRLLKSNENDFVTFITLTFEENYSDVKNANKLLGKFLNNMKTRYKNDLKYICIPEFQKRGAIHYHLVTNIEYSDSNLIIQDEKKIWDRRKTKWQIFKTCKYWKYGFSSVIHLENINVIGYLTKYLTKDIDNRLFGFRRYTYSMNLKHPTITYLDLEELKDLNFYHDKVLKSNLIYESNFLTKDFYEYEYNEEGAIYNVLYKEYKLVT